MAEEQKKMSRKSQFITLGIIAAVCCGLWLFKTLNPKAYKESGVQGFIESPSKDAVRDDDAVHCELHAKKVYDAGELMSAQSPRYDYTFTCQAKQKVILSDLTITVGEVVTARNTGVGKDEKSDRRLDSERVGGQVTVQAGEKYEKTGRLERKHSISGSRGYIELNGRLRFPEAGKDESPTAPKTFLRLRAPAA